MNPNSNESYETRVTNAAAKVFEQEVDFRQEITHKTRAV